jgi:hypothetical protein
MNPNTLNGRMQRPRIDYIKNRADRLVAVLAKTGCLSWRGIQKRVKSATGVDYTHSQIQTRIGKVNISLKAIRDGEDANLVSMILQNKDIRECAESSVLKAAKKVKNFNGDFSVLRRKADKA